MSRSFTLTGTKSELSVDYFPPINLKENKQYKLGLVGFYTYNTIPNIDVGKNRYYYGVLSQYFSIPTGIYEISDIDLVLKKQLGNNNISLKINKNTQKCELYSKYKIDFTHEDSIAHLLGFSKAVYESEITHTSNLTVQTSKVVTLRVECNVTSGAHYNGELVHTIHEFGIAVDPGFAITEVPHNIIYYPVNTRTINNISLRIIDQDGDLINFRNELIVVRLELKEDGD